MKFKVYYFNDPSDSLEVTATTGEQACWRFVQARPRRDTSQVSAEALQAGHPQSPEIVHYRASDLIDRPEPPDMLEPRKLVLRRTHTREIYFTLSGSAADLRLRSPVSFSKASTRLKANGNYQLKSRSNPRPFYSPNIPVENAFSTLKSIPMLPATRMPLAA